MRFGWTLQLCLTLTVACGNDGDSDDVGGTGDAGAGTAGSGTSPVADQGAVAWWQRFGTEWDESLRGGIVALDDGLALLGTLGQETTFGLADVVRLRVVP